MDLAQVLRLLEKEIAKTMRLLNFRYNSRISSNEGIEATVYSKLQVARNDCLKQMCVQWTLEILNGSSVCKPGTNMMSSDLQ